MIINNEIIKYERTCTLYVTRYTDYTLYEAFSIRQKTVEDLKKLDTKSLKTDRHL